MLSDACHCIRNNLNVTDIAVPLGIFIQATQLGITYVFIRMRNDLVDEVFASLREIIIKRKS